uniref:hypothetical protein n=1 Tax=Kroppenstedtia sanguinis TaxID=1380684 RepID=UPI003D1A3250
MKYLPEMSADEAYNQLIALMAEDYKPLVKRLDHFDTTYDVKFDSPTRNQSGAPQEGEKKMSVAILLDASGSMSGRVEGGEKMKLSKKR